MALCMAKARGKWRYQKYEPVLRAAALERIELEADLQRAVQHNEFVLHYQPAVTLASGNILAIEALVRWNHPKRGLLLPADFLSLAKETGLIVPLGRWVLKQACQDGRQWQRQFTGTPPLLVSVNMTGRELQEARLVTDVAEAAQTTGLDAGTLVLELTDGAGIEDTETLAKLCELHKRGVKLALDNFGAGSSSLASLRDLPVDIVKLDHSFVARMESSMTDAAVVRAVVALGNAVGLVTVADGIERADQLVALRAMGCHAGQGYYLSKPLPAEALESLLAGWADGSPRDQLPPALRLSA